MIASRSLVAAASAVAVLAGSDAAAATTDTWFRAADHTAYCEWKWEPVDTLLCFSPRSGRWVRLTRTFDSKVVAVGKGADKSRQRVSLMRVTKGRDPALVGFRRTTRIRIVADTWFNDDRLERGYSILCGVKPGSITCWAKDNRGFRFRADGSLELGKALD